MRLLAIEKDVLRYILYEEGAMSMLNLQEITDQILKEPKNVDLFYQRGILFKKIEEYAKAVDDFSKAITIEGEVPKYLMELAQCYTAQKRHDAAVQMWSKLVEINPSAFNFRDP